MPNKSWRYILRDKSILKRLLAILVKWYRGWSQKNENLTYEVIIRPYKKNRTLAQNNLMWMWLNHIAVFFEKEHGQRFSDEAWKEEFQEKYLGYKVIKTPSGPKKKLIGTSGLNIAQFTEFLNNVERYANTELGINLPHPEDIYYEAIGK